MSKKNRRPSPFHWKNLLAVICLLAVLIVAAFLVYYLYFQTQFSAINVAQQAQIQAASLPIISSFGADKLDTESFYYLKKSGRLEYNRQTIGLSTGKDAPLPPIDISVYDPKIGRTLIIYWRKPEYFNYQSVRLYRGEATAGEKKLVANQLPTTGQYKDSGLQDDVVYYYEVRSVATISGVERESDNNNSYPAFPTDRTPPTSPEEVAATNTEKGDELVISWVNPKDDDLAAIIIYRSEKFGELTPSQEIAKVKDGSETYLDQSVLDNVIYYYTVTALDKSGNESPKTLLITEQGNSHPFFESVNSGG